MGTCQEIMLTNPACCLLDDTVSMIVTRMQSENVDTFLVIENYQSKKLIGIVTDNDIVLKLVGKSLSARTTAVHEIMTTDLITCYPSDDIDVAVEQMNNQKIRRLPVVDTDGQVIGIIIQALRIQARISVRIDNNYNVKGFTTKVSLNGWDEVVGRVQEFAKRVALVNSINTMWEHQDESVGLPALAAR